MWSRPTPKQVKKIVADDRKARPVARRKESQIQVAPPHQSYYTLKQLVYLLNGVICIRTIRDLDKNGTIKTVRIPGRKDHYVTVDEINRLKAKINEDIEARMAKGSQVAKK